jgi:hypothetical protein
MEGPDVFVPIIKTTALGMTPSNSPFCKRRNTF